MKKLALLTVIFALGAGQAVAQAPAPAPVPAPAAAPDPTGDWRVEEGTAHIRVAICDGALWGVIGWEQSPGTDSENPDPALRSRPTLGMPILVNMKPDAKKPEANRWVGKIYNAKNGKMYDSNVTLISPTALKVQGCVLGVFCGGETWAKVTTPPVATPTPAPAPSPKGAQKGAAGGAAATTGVAPSASAISASVCSRLSALPRPTH